MEADTYVVIVHEDELSEAVLRRLLAHGDRRFVVSHSIPAGGFGKIKRDVEKYKTACRMVPHVVLTDLDQAPCPSALMASWNVGKLPPELLFRVAVREVEAWLLADVDGLSAFLGIPVSRLPANPEAVMDPKQILINAARRSRYRRMASEIVPAPGSAAIQGVLYSHHLCRFVNNDWNVIAASGRAPSLARMLKRLQDFMK